MPAPPFLDAIAAAATAWRDPDYAPRQAAAEATLAVSDVATEEALAFAVNQHMERLSRRALKAWVGEAGAGLDATVAVVHGGRTPLDGLRDALAVIVLGGRYVGVVSAGSPALLPAFAREVQAHAPDAPLAFAPLEEALGRADLLVGTAGTADDAALGQAYQEAGLTGEKMLLRPETFGLSVLDGHESDDERERLAEDVLLHEGFSPRGVALVWAPRALNPDPYLDAFAAFRGVFPAHPSTPGRLTMQRAFLKAGGAPHAYGEGLEFLLSKGDPEVQAPGHVRWAEYDDLAEVQPWMQDHRAHVSVVTARAHLRRLLPSGWPVEALGNAHRPALGEEDVLGWLRRQR